MDEFEEQERRRDRRTQIWFNAFAYTWRVATNVFYVLVILYVFSRIGDRNETITVAVLGSIYITLRSIGIGLVLMFAQFGMALQKELNHIKKLADRSFEAASLDEVERRNTTARRKLYIDMGFLAIVSVICLWQLFSVL